MANLSSIPNTILYKSESSGTTWGLFWPLPVVFVSQPHLLVPLASVVNGFVSLLFNAVLYRRETSGTIWGLFVSLLFKSKSHRFLEVYPLVANLFMAPLFKEFENFLLRRV